MPIPVILGALLSKLAESGLSTLAGAIEAKGKEAVENIIGVKIPDKAEELTPALLVELKQAEMANEVDLQKIALEETKAYLADTQDARKREAAIATSDSAPMLNKVITPVLALIVTVGGGVILQINPDAEVKYAVVSIMMLVLGYYFGTSQGSTKASQLFRDMARKNGSGN